MSAVLPQDVPLTLIGGIASPDKPILILAQAKQSQTIDDASANA